MSAIQIGRLRNAGIDAAGELHLIIARGVKCRKDYLPQKEFAAIAPHIEIMEISKATKDDIPGLCELLGFLFAQEAEFQPDRSLQSAGLQEIIDFPERGQILVLREGTSLLGMISLLYTVSTALGGRVIILEDMVVHPDHRGSGAGSKLLQAAIDFAKSVACRRITLLTDQTNKSAQRFYKRYGFTISKMVPMRLSS